MVFTVAFAMQFNLRRNILSSLFQKNAYVSIFVEIQG